MPGAGVHQVPAAEVGSISLIDKGRGEGNFITPFLCFEGERGETMNEKDRLDFVGALGEEFCTVLDPVVGADLCPQDGFEVFAKVLGKDFGRDELATLTDSQVEQLRMFASTWLECPNLTNEHLREVVHCTLSRW